MRGFPVWLSRLFASVGFEALNEAIYKFGPPEILSSQIALNCPIGADATHHLQPAQLGAQLTSRPHFNLNRAAVLSEWRGLRSGRAVCLEASSNLSDTC